MSEHTPTPWFYSTERSPRGGVIGSDGWIFVREEDALFLARAVNNFDKMLTALKAAEPFLSRFEQHTEEKFGTAGPLEKCVSDVREAIAEAEK